jgi:hypothetical protein
MTAHRPRPFWGAEGVICAACHDWWPCAQATPPRKQVKA